MIWTTYVYGLAISYSVFLLINLWKNWKFYYLSWKMKGPIAFPFIGNALIFWNSSCQVINIISKIAQKYGSPARFWLGSKFVVFIFSPEDIETVIKPVIQDKGDVYDNVSDFIGGHGLLSLNGNAWKMHRKLLNPTIQSYNILNSFQRSFNENIQILIKKLEVKNEADAFNIYHYIEAAAADIVCNTTFGVKMQLQQNENQHFLNAVNDGMFLVGVKTLEPWYQYKLIMRFSKYNNLNKSSKSAIQDFVKKIYDQKLIEFNNARSTENISTNTKEDEYGIRRIRNFIDECMRLTMDQKCFSEQDTITESITMLLAGFETTAITVSNAILLLAMNPEYQEKVFDEIQHILRAGETTITTDVINQLYHTDRLIKETLRLFPTIPIITRIARNKMKIGKYTVPIGTEFIISIFDLHRSESIWGPEANKFNPNNFLPENLEGKHSHSYIPFALGVRNCIGSRYAQMLVRFMVAALVRNYKFTTEMKYEELRLTWSITLKLENGHIVKLQKRNV